MSYSAQPQDSSSPSIPIPAAYQLGNTWSGILGSLFKQTDSSNTVAPIATSDIVKEALINGQIFTATTNEINNAGNGARAGFSLFNPNTAKNIILFSLDYYDSNADSGGFQLRTVTTNPSLATSITPVNSYVGGGSSIASVTALNTGFTPSGTLKGVYSFILDRVGTVRFIHWDNAILLPKSINSGITFSPQMSTNTTYYFAINATWIEF